MMVKDVFERSLSSQQNLKMSNDPSNKAEPYEGFPLTDSSPTEAEKLCSHAEKESQVNPYEGDACNQEITKPDNLNSHKVILTGQHSQYTMIPSKNISLRCYLKPTPSNVSFPYNHSLAQSKNVGEDVSKADESVVCNQNNLKKSILLMKTENPQCQTEVRKTVKSNECDFCGKTFSKPHAMKMHKMIHTGEKPFKCDVCGKAFRQFDVLKVHKRRHDGYKPFQCNSCPKTFVTRTELLLHISRHDTFKNLDKTSGNSLRLLNRRHECDVCGKIFTRSDSVTRHKKKHMNGKSLNTHSNIWGINKVSDENTNPPCKLEHDSSTGNFLSNQSLVKPSKIPEKITRIDDSEENNKSDLWKELESSEANSIGYICLVCNNEFDIPKEFVDHMKTHVEKTE